MNAAKNKNLFPEIRGKILFNEPLFKHTTFRLGGPCKAWVEAEDETDLEKILTFAGAEEKRMFIIGSGSNVLARDKGFDGIVVRLGGRRFKNVDFFGTTVRVGAGALLSGLVYRTCKNGLKDLEGLTGIPGTVGGAIFMNSGYKQNISDFVETVKVMDKATGSVRIMKRENLDFGYRHSNLARYIILEATLSLRRGNKKMSMKKIGRLLNIKKRAQPLESFSAGCIFRNPPGEISASRYIDMLGLKGKRVGGAEVSERHANFIINAKNAKASDILRLITFIKKRVKSRFSVDLTPEIIII